MSAKPVILVVDDDVPILTLMRNILREFGFDARVASTGAAALEEAASSSPDLVLLDLKMPGMPGEDVIAGLRRAGLRDVPILILSGEPVPEQEIARLGVSGAIQKPFDVAALISDIRAQVGAPK